MPALTYSWQYVTNLYGLGVPTITTLEAASGIYTKDGTLLMMSSGQVTPAVGSVVLPVGLAAEVIAVAATAADPVKVMILRPGDVIKGTADADASALSGFSGKLGDFNSDGSFDVGDTSNGCASVWRTEDSGLTVFLVLTIFATS
jgi:hypothetical protein